MSKRKSIFKNASTTYFYSSLFFPKAVWEDVSILYAFVRVADDFVDCVPQQKEKFLQFRKDYEKALKKPVGNQIIDDFVVLGKKFGFEDSWTMSFLDAMESDLSTQKCKTIDETKTYMYGSAEVIGLYMAKILHLDKKSYKSAKMQGRAMQYINFLRDIAEDLDLGRIYVPESVWREHGFKVFNKSEIFMRADAFRKLMQSELDRYESWQSEAVPGYKYIPWRYRVAIKTASDMYSWTGKEIRKDPFRIFDEKIKPSKMRVFLNGLKNMLLI